MVSKVLEIYNGSVIIQKTVFGANSDLTGGYSAVWRKHDE